jgi:hypothetical protein
MGKRFPRVNLPLTAVEIIDAWCDEAMRATKKVFPNTYIGKFEADIAELTNAGYFNEYEVKVSRGDFNVDAGKTALIDDVKTSKHDLLLSGNRANRFYYIVPTGMIKP